MELVIFIGIQATGKSSFYRDRFFRTHIRVNLDMLKTRHREQIIFQACLEGKQSLVIDNTNPTIQDRDRYISIAKEHNFRIIGYYFESKISDCLSRNSDRQGNDRVPDVALYDTHKKLELPSLAEGFDELYYVKITPNRSFIIQPWQDEI
jgi:predicted kinase